MKDMIPFMENVRAMVYGRLSCPKQRAAVRDVPLHWGIYVPPKDSLNIIIHLLAGRDYRIAPLGETFCATAHHPNGRDSYLERQTKVCLYTNGVPERLADSHVPYGRGIAFTLIHELGHVACGCCTTQHESEVWAKACKEMGIKEERYSLKGPDWEYGFQFSDDKLWAAIQALPTYPGDIYPYTDKKGSYIPMPLTQ